MLAPIYTSSPGTTEVDFSAAHAGAHTKTLSTALCARVRLIRFRGATCCANLTFPNGRQLDIAMASRGASKLSTVSCHSFAQTLPLSAKRAQSKSPHAFPCAARHSEVPSRPPRATTTYGRA
jgi:hypothetical protein